MSLSGGEYTIKSSTISGNTAPAGGGLEVISGTLTLLSSTVSGNTATSNSGGGGLFVRNTGAATVVGTTISGNAAPLGGGISSQAQTSGPNPPLRVVNSTISGNRATAGPGGGAHLTGSSRVIENSTIARNSATSGTGGGVYSSGSTTTLYSTIVGDNRVASNPSDVEGSFAADYTLIERRANASVFPATPGPETNVYQDPLLGDLADNGGPTLTHMLLPGSPALDKGASPSGLATDQRGAGFVRSYGAAADIGAIEWQGELAPTPPDLFSPPPVPPSPPTADGLVLTVTSADDDLLAGGGLLTLREAILAANAAEGIGKIVFDGSLSGRTITLLQGSLEITDGLVIEGPGADALTIDGGGLFTILTIDDGSASSRIDVSISGLTLTHGTKAIDNAEDLWVFDSQVSNNSAATGGGGVEHRLGTLVIDGSRIERNSSAANGGGVLVTGGDAWVLGSVVSGNTARGNGGGVAALAGTGLVITDSRLETNAVSAADVAGGGVYVEDSQAWVTRSAAIGNKAEGVTAAQGGGLGQLRGTVFVEDSDFSDNTATVTTIYTAAFGVLAGGGGLSVEAGRAMVRGSRFEDNSTTAYGGGLAAFTGGELSVDSSRIYANTAGAGGGLLLLGAKGAVDRSTIADNLALGGSGGGIAAPTAELVIRESTISGNTSSGAGGGMYQGMSTTTIVNSTFSGNTAGTINNPAPPGSAGGAVYDAWGSTTLLLNSTVTDSTAGDAGGAIFLDFLNGPPSQWTIISSIIANTRSTGFAGDADIAGYGQGVTLDHSLVESFEYYEPYPPTGEASTNVIGRDPLLGPLADNGGPTMTHALSAGSPAINAGANPRALAHDQRGEGFARAVGLVDIGAVEGGFSQSPLVVQVPEPPYFQNSTSTTVRLSDDGQMLQVFVSGEVLSIVERPVGSVSDIRIVGAQSANDVLTVDFANGSPVPIGGLSFDPGSEVSLPYNWGRNELKVVNGGVVDTLRYALDEGGSGTVALDGSVISFSDVRWVDVDAAAPREVVADVGDSVRGVLARIFQRCDA